MERFRIKFSMCHRCKGAGGVSAKRSQSARPLGEGVLDLIGRAVRSVRRSLSGLRGDTARPASPKLFGLRRSQDALKTLFVRIFKRLFAQTYLFFECFNDFS